MSTSSIHLQEGILEGCDTTGVKARFEEYCGTACRATILELETSPETFAKMKKKSSSAQPHAPTRYEIIQPCYRQFWLEVRSSKTDPRTKDWNYTPNSPHIRFMRLIVAFEAKLQAIDASYDFTTEVIFSASERRR